MENNNFQYKKLLVFFWLLSLVLSIIGLPIAINKIVGNSKFFSYSSDTYIDNQWAISKIELNKAWKISTGSNTVKVGIIDSGIDGTHEDLIDNINASLSYVFNQNLVTPLQDILSHGTHVAGIIGASGNNDIGVSGICWDVDLSSLRVASDNGIGLDFDSIKDAINYASLNNIPILNISLGDFRCLIDDQVFSDLLNSVSNYSGLIVCAAGNQGFNLDSNTIFPDYQVFPACYLFPNILAVGNSDQSDNKAIDSNYGPLSVDLFAPGTNIKSTLPNDEYGCESGTSMAAPMVSGVAALLLSIDPTLTTSQLKSAILGGVDLCDNLSNKCLTGGRLNAFKSALNVIPCIPEQINPVSFSCDTSFPRILRIDCENAAHYSLTFSGPTSYQVTLYTVNKTSPIFSGEFNDSLNHQIVFASNLNQQVFVRIDNLSNDNGYFNANALQVASHNYNSYRYYDENYHKSVCACGLYILEQHVYENMSSECTMCSLPPLNLSINDEEEDNSAILISYH